MKKIILLFVCLICINVYAANIRINDSLQTMVCAANTFITSENSFGVQYSYNDYTKYAVKKQGMFFLRTELGFVPSLSIGYGGTTQFYLAAGLGLEGLIDMLDGPGISDRRISLGTRLGGPIGTKWGWGIDLGGGLAEGCWIMSLDIDGAHWRKGDYHSDFYASFVLSYKNWDYILGLEFADGDWADIPARLGVGYNFRSKKYWTYREEKEIEERERYRLSYSPQSATTTPVGSPCTNHFKAGVYNESSLKERINNENDGIVGIYEDFYSGGYKLGVIKHGNSYRIIYMSGQRSKCWEFGHVIAELRPSATNGLFKATWYRPDFSTTNDCIVMFDGVTMVVSLPSDKMTFIKMYPQQSSPNTSTKEPQSWSGTGWALGNGYVVTNNHVAEGARTITIKGIDGDLNTGYSAEVVATDKTNDIAVLKIKDSRFNGFGAIPYAVSSRIAEKGEGVFVLGYPMTQVLGNEVKYTAGEINSITGFQGDVATYQISAPVTHGNSGGPMFDNKGNVIGIVNSGITDKEIAENVGYAIKISYLKTLIESAGLNITLPSNNTISSLSKQEKIKKVERFVYYIECSK